MILPPPTSTLFPYTTLFRSFLDWRSSTQMSVMAGNTEVDAYTQLISRTRAESRQNFARHSRDSGADGAIVRSEEHTSELQSHSDLVCRLLLEKKKKNKTNTAVRCTQSTRRRRPTPSCESKRVASGPAPPRILSRPSSATPDRAAGHRSCKIQA